ncbi:MAG: SDR family oxidoreductase [Deltaproteobacteria bacterium]|nr:SDR family oxidoreductase [Deltaproteobacteria bacterium]
MKKLQIIILGVALAGLMSSAALAGSKGLVVVAGSTGRTGRLVVKHLQAEGYEVRAMVRSLKKGKRVLGGDVPVVKADVTNPASLPPFLKGADFLISAIGTGGKAKPEDVDYGGSVALIDAAKAAGIKKFIMVSSGGVTWKIHPINWFSGGVLKWKRKAELYLRASGLTHVIVRPNGGLSDELANTKKLIFTQSDGFGSKISRDDVAVVCVKALVYNEADNKTFEIENDDDGSAVKDVDWKKTFGAMTVKSDNF